MSAHSWSERSRSLPGGCKKLCLVLLCHKNSAKKDLEQTIEGFLNQEEGRIELVLLLWCADCPPTLVEFARELVSKQQQVGVIESQYSFLGNLPASLESISQFDSDGVILCACGTILKTRCISFLLSKKAEYATGTILAASGIRIFSHEKLVKAEESLQNGEYLKYYSESKEDRVVHFFPAEFCYISTNILSKAADYHNPEFGTLDNLWFSFVAQYYLEQRIWKVRMDDAVTVQREQSPALFPRATDAQLRSLTRFYSHIYELDWPKRISKPFYSLDKLNAVQSSTLSSLALWDKGFGGVNMLSEPACQLDFASAAAYGVHVIRIGAVGDAKDLAYLIDPNAQSFDEDNAHFLTVLPRLMQSLRNAGQVGLKVVITLADVPGCEFHSRSGDSPNFPFWESPECRTRVAKFWGLVAKSLTGQKEIIMAYDLINEPYTSDDKAADYFDEMPMTHREELHQFQLDAIREIRQYDKDTMVVVKGTWYASPRAIRSLEPLPDPHVAYAFHMYASPLLTLPAKHATGVTCSYPGPVRRWAKCRWSNVELNQQSLQTLLHSTVRQWQLQHRIPSTRILVAEFGICRTVPGAKQYLTDLVEIFQEFGWSWLLFSFRDEEWDAMDYELGTDYKNMLNRSPSDLFMSVAQYFS